MTGLRARIEVLREFVRAASSKRLARDEPPTPNNPPNNPPSKAPSKVRVTASGVHVADPSREGSAGHPPVPAGELDATQVADLRVAEGLSLDGLDATLVVDSTCADPPVPAGELDATQVVGVAALDEDNSLVAFSEGSRSTVIGPAEAEDRSGFSASTGAKGLTAILACVEGPLQGEVFRIGSGRYELGREGKDLVLPDPTRRISRHHATLSSHAEGLTIKANPEIRARNPTVVNGRPIDEATLCDGDEIFMGDCRFVIRLV